MDKKSLACHDDDLFSVWGVFVVYPLRIILLSYLCDMKRFGFFGLFFCLVFLLAFAFPPALAQNEGDDIQITIELPDEISLNEETVVTIEVTDKDGQPVDGADLEVFFDPEENVFDEILNDCGDPDFFDECQANNRAVPGVFESVFDLLDSPVTLEAEVGNVIQSVELSVSGSSGGTTAAPSSASSSASSPSASGSVAGTVSPSSVQVGPYPSIWLLLLPLALMCAVVTYVVIRTTEK